jgi:hypothetical protein
MSEGCTILQACRKIAFNRYGKKVTSDKINVLRQDEEYWEKINEALVILENILAKYSDAKILKCEHYKNLKDPDPNYIKFNPKTMKLDLKNNGICVEGEHESYDILFDGEDENQKHCDPTYINVEIKESILEKAEYFQNAPETRKKEAKKRGRKPKVEQDDIEAFYRDNIDSFRDIKQEAVVASVLEHFPTIGKTTATIRVKECKEKILKEKFLSEINY